MMTREEANRLDDMRAGAVCGASHRRGPAGWWLCTRRAGHGGPHAAAGRPGEVFLVWEDGRVLFDDTEEDD